MRVGVRAELRSRVDCPSCRCRGAVPGACQGVGRPDQVGDLRGRRGQLLVVVLLRRRRRRWGHIRG